MAKTAAVADRHTAWGRALARGIQLAAGDAPAVDRDKRIIRGCSLVERGEAMGHGFWLDSEFIDQAVAFGKQAEPRGVKARFTHPGLCSDGLGKYLGRWHNFRRDGDKCRADLVLADMAAKTPEGDLAGYVMGMAEEDPEAFGISITFGHDWPAAEEFADEHKELDQEAGRLLFKSPDKDNERNLIHARMAQLRTGDAVDDPAANADGLFGRGSDLAARAERFLDWAFSGQGEAPELEPAFGISAERAREFIQGYLDRRNVRLSAAPGGSGVSAKKEDTMAGESKPATESKPDVAALQAEAQKAGVEEGRKSVRGELEAMLAAFPKDRAFALESFAKGLSVEQAKAAQAEALSVENERLAKENAELKAKTPPAPPPAGKGANFSETSAGAVDFMSAARAMVAEKGLSLGAAMSIVAREQPELHAKYLAGGK